MNKSNEQIKSKGLSIKFPTGFIVRHTSILNQEIRCILNMEHQSI